MRALSTGESLLAFSGKKSGGIRTPRFHDNCSDSIPVEQSNMERDASKSPELLKVITTENFRDCKISSKMVFGEFACTIDMQSS